MNRIYLLKSRSHYFAYKIGISNNVQRRVAQIQKSSKIKVSVIFTMPLFFAYEFEHFLHRIYRFNRVRSIDGSGCTEWFWFVIPLTPILFFLLFLVLQLAPIFILFYYVLSNY